MALLISLMSTKVKAQDTTYKEEEVVNDEVTSLPISVIKNQIMLKSGGYFMRMRDQVIANYDYRSLNIPVILEFNRIGLKWNQTIHSSFNKFYFKTNTNDGFRYTDFDEEVDGLTQHNIRTKMFVFNYALTRNIIQKKKFKLAIGGELSYRSLNKEFLFLDYYNQLKEHFTTINICANIHYTLTPKTTLKYSLSSSLITRAKRKHFVEDELFNTYYSTALFKGYFGVNSNIALTYQFTQALSAEINYMFQYFQYNYPRREQLAIQGITLGIGFKF